jgi:hypothetical protein
MELGAVATLRCPIGPERLEGEALTLPTAPDDAVVVEALRSALAGDSGAATRPGQLRQRVESALGAENSVRLRPVVHQVVAAAEENLPGYLTRIAPLTGGSLQQLSGELATARGWSSETAQRVTQIWARALGFGSVVDSWPSQPLRPAVDPLVVPGPEMTAPVPANDPGGTHWPIKKSLLKRFRPQDNGQQVLGIVRAYAGMSLLAYCAIAGVFVVAIIVVLLSYQVVVGLPIFLVGVAMRRALRSGVLLATSTGVEFTPVGSVGAKARTTDRMVAAWSEVSLTEGVVSVIRVGDHKIQVGPFNREFARAAAAYAGNGV